LLILSIFGKLSQNYKIHQYFFMNITRLYWVFQVICWVLIIAIVAKYSPLETTNIQYHLLHLVITFIVGFTSTAIYATIHVKRFRKSTSLSQNLFSLTIGVCLVGLLFFGIDLVYFGKEVLAQKYKSFFNYLLLYLDEVWLVLPWFLFYHFLHFARISFSQQKRLVDTETQLKSAELEILKKQLNPHFLFNALNSIKALTLTEPLVARDALIELSELLRLILNLEEQKKIVFEEEYKMTEHYLSLEKMRFDNRLNYTFDIQDEAKYASVLPMTLQTLIENAVKHGISKNKNGGVIEIKARVENKKTFIITVKNTGQYLPNSSSRRGIGTNNLQRRLEITYGDAATFNIKNVSNEFVESTLTLPLEDLTHI
jgi:two-component system, LytTR family, sensor kinase